MTHTIVQYRVKPGRGDENAQLVRAVYDELAELAPDGFSYATYRAEDGVSFLHMAAGPGPLRDLEAFRRFTAGLRDRCESGPEFASFSEVGSYRPAKESLPL
jgi:hypothetical protein